MAGPLYYDRVLETSTTTGTGTYTLAGAVTGHQAFSVVGNSNTCFYSAWDVDGNGNPSGGWEVGLGTYTSSGTTLARTTVLASSNGGAAVSWSAGTRRIALVNPAVRTAYPDVQVFTAGGTWTKPTGATFAHVVCISGGGGGGSGRKGAAGSARCGGGGGGGGSVSFATFQASILSGTETVTVGAGGGGGTGQTTNSTNGNPGTAGADTTFGSWLKAVGGSAGSGGTTTGGNGGANFVNGWCELGGNGGNGLTTSASAGKASGETVLSLICGRAAGGGGGGGGVNTSNAAFNGAAGGARPAMYDGSGAGSAGTSGGAGGVGGSVTANLPYGGGGGGGGGGSNTTTAGAGGNGGSYGGGGGGGGGATDSVGNSGAGGTGADGICVVISW